MKNEMPSLLMDEKICFIRLLPNTLQNFWQVIPCSFEKGVYLGKFTQP